MSCAFPTLFPTGAGGFMAPRECVVTVGNYFKHLVKYDDGRFTRHPRFRYFALNTEMLWRALQAGRVYIKQHPKDARLSLDELKSMVECGGEQFSKKVMHYASNLRGTKQYWFKQSIRLIAMIDKLGLPIVFFTHSAADASGLNWLVSSVKTAQKTVQAAAKPSMRIRLLQTGFSMRESASLLKPTTWTFWVPQTTGSDLSDNIVAVHTCMG